MSHPAKLTQTGMLIGVPQGTEASYSTRIYLLEAAGNHPLPPAQVNTKVDGREMPVRCTSKWLIHQMREKKMKSKDGEAVKTKESARDR